MHCVFFPSDWLWNRSVSRYFATWLLVYEEFRQNTCIQFCFFYTVCVTLSVSWYGVDVTWLNDFWYFWNLISSKLQTDCECCVSEKQKLNFLLPTERKRMREDFFEREIVKSETTATGGWCNRFDWNEKREWGKEWDHVRDDESVGRNVYETRDDDEGREQLHALLICVAVMHHKWNDDLNDIISSHMTQLEGKTVFRAENLP